ncbi:hypothetical protein [uncultured Streptomyces sp.]|uniref:hypothetical protein n=1 Tax=uncultured Streptomyces sp. TaxID=174707 RepID=UPI002617BBE7|nr:hypothetical protein [uncultured Streptomyces sp.]
MGGTDDTIADDDALYVLSALLLTPERFPGVLGDDYVAACAALSLEPFADGYGLVLGQDGAGARWTVVVDDVSLVAGAIAAWDCGMEYDLSPDDRSMVTALPGWPLALAVSAPGVPAPHDPEPAEPGGPAPLSPPDAETWGPAVRRLGADEVGANWAAWRGRIEDPPSGPGAPSASVSSGGHPGVRRALAEARGYLDDAPPPGRVRTEFATEAARTVRADGPGWSLVARTDDMAFLLLDDEPGEVIPVRRGPELPSLLAGLAELAARPA